MLTKMAACGRSQKHVSRNLHRLIHGAGLTLPVQVDTVELPVRVLCGKPRIAKVQYPVLFPSAWARCIFSTGGHMLLGGFSLDDQQGFRNMLTTFWDRFRYVRPELDLYNQPWDLSLAIPIAYHGDEGRGKLKRPIMITAVQPIVSHQGPDHTNLSGQLSVFKLWVGPFCCSAVLVRIFLTREPKYQALLHNTTAVHCPTIRAVRW